jgi:hypothetical protein
VTPADTVVQTYLEDLQSEMEAGSRKLDSIDVNVDEMRRVLLSRQLEQSNLAGRLVRQVADLRKCLAQQRASLAALRASIAAQRAHGKPPKP